jgi:hypothetical protein
MMPDLVAQHSDLLSKYCSIQKVEPSVFASDAEVSLVVETLGCPGGATQVIKAYREEAQAIRELIRTKT